MCLFVREGQTKRYKNKDMVINTDKWFFLNGKINCIVTKCVLSTLKNLRMKKMFITLLEELSKK